MVSDPIGKKKLNQKARGISQLLSVCHQCVWTLTSSQKAAWSPVWYVIVEVKCPIQLHHLVLFHRAHLSSQLAQDSVAGALGLLRSHVRGGVGFLS